MKQARDGGLEESLPSGPGRPARFSLFFVPPCERRPQPPNMSHDHPVEIATHARAVVTGPAAFLCPFGRAEVGRPSAYGGAVRRIRHDRDRDLRDAVLPSVLDGAFPPGGDELPVMRAAA